MTRRKPSQCQGQHSSQSATEYTEPTTKNSDNQCPGINIDGFLSNPLDQQPNIDPLTEVSKCLERCEKKLTAALQVQQASYQEIQELILAVLKKTLALVEKNQDKHMAQNEPNSSGFIEHTAFPLPVVIPDSPFSENVDVTKLAETECHKDEVVQQERTPERSERAESDMPISNSPETSDESLPADAWILETWLKFPYDGQSDPQAERLFEEGKLQQGIIYIDRILASNLPPESTINAMLLQSCALRMCNLVEKALTYTERATRLADKENMQALVRKSQFYRGLCLYDLGICRDATWCFIFAGGLIKFGHLLRKFTKLAEEKRKTLPLDDRRRKRSESFRAIPLGG